MIISPLPFMGWNSAFKGPLNFLGIVHPSGPAPNLSGRPDLALSADGQSWLLRPFPAPDGYTISGGGRGVLFVAGQFWLLVRNGSTGSFGAMVTANGVDWDLVQIGAAGARNVYDIAMLGSGRAIACSLDVVSEVWRSDDLESWTAQAIPTSGVRAAGSDGDRVVLALGDRSTLYSSNGEAWSSGSTGLTAGNPNFMRHVDGSFVCGGSTGPGQIAVSAAGISFDQQTLDTGTSSPFNIVRGAGRNVLIGQFAAASGIFQSETLTGWERPALPGGFEGGFFDIAFHGAFVLATNQVAQPLLFSNDGLSFALRAHGLPAGLRLSRLAARAG